MKILFLDKVHEVLEEELKKHNHQYIDGVHLSYEQLCKEVSFVDGIIVRSRFQIDKHFLEHGKNLKFIARAGAGIENIDEEYCNEKNIVIFNAPEGNRNAVAEHALGMLLNLFNHLTKSDHEVRNGIWDREGNRGIELAGKTVGIIGFGNNGSQFAQLLSGFDCNILAYDKYKSGFETERVQEVTLDEIYQKADVVSFHIPQTEETIAFANASFFNAFQKPIYLINLSRGKVVKTEDLLQAIDNNQVLGACLDVLEYENLFKSGRFIVNEIPVQLQQLLKSDKILFSPHVGGWTVESYYKISKVLAEKIIEKFWEQ